MKWSNPIFDELLEQEQRALRAAREVMTRSYNLYSGFFVGAAVLSVKGQMNSGCFMENASFGLGICAEASALLTANSRGELDIELIAVVGGRDPNFGGNVVTPCGRCRQLIFEVSQICNRDIRVLCANGNLSRVVQTTIQELLPMPFGPDDVGLSEKLAAWRTINFVTNRTAPDRNVPGGQEGRFDGAPPQK